MEFLGLPPPPSISNVPEVKMVSTSKKPSASAISVESIVASVESVVATVVASVVMSVEPFVVDCSLVVSVSIVVVSTV